MMNEEKTVEQAIQEALNDGVDLSREEYAERCRRADEITAVHGVDGEAPMNEEDRARRMAMNFYGSMINITMALLSEVSELSRYVAELYSKVAELKGGN